MNAAFSMAIPSSHSPYSFQYWTGKESPMFRQRPAELDSRISWGWLC
jgi:hypothetical protein